MGAPSPLVPPVTITRLPFSPRFMPRLHTEIVGGSILSHGVYSLEFLRTALSRPSSGSSSVLNSREKTCISSIIWFQFFLTRATVRTARIRNWYKWPTSDPCNYRLTVFLCLLLLIQEVRLSGF